MGTPWITTREVVKAATDSKRTAYNDNQVDRAIASATLTVEGTLRRKFYPRHGIFYKNYPNYPSGSGNTFTVELEEDEVVSVSALTSGGLTIASTDYFLEPINSGPPYDRIEIDLGSSASFNGGPTWQRNVAITGVRAFWSTENPAGALAEALDSSETLVDVTNSTLIGVGNVLLCESERMIVTGKQLIDTTVNLGGNIAATQSVDTVGVADGTAFAVGEVILIDSERMLIRDIAGNNLIVRRAYDGSTLAAHTAGADIYAPRTLQVERGALGTTAVAHNTATALTVHAVPGLVEEFGVAVALVNLGQREAGYARTIGSGESERETSGRGLSQIRRDAISAFRRVIRSEAV